ncbi:hypothetical protein F5887DRAFT_875517 [Amanita rubescens]|nr:hypothetical protein F5887DRAFT_875517 [Amanita rubescens]
MFSTLARSAPTPNIARSLKKLLPNDLPPSLTSRSGNLYEVLSRKPDGGVGKEIHQMRWNNKQIEGSYWKVTRSKFRCEGKCGTAWGILYWKGKRVTAREEEIRGGLKYTWAEGRSKPLKPSAADNVRMETPSCADMHLTRRFLRSSTRTRGALVAQCTVDGCTNTGPLYLTCY